MLQRALPYASEASIRYDMEREAYIGEVLSRGITHRVKSPVLEDVEYTLERVLNDEYLEMTRTVGLDNGRPAIGDLPGGMESLPGSRNILDQARHMDAYIDFDEARGLYVGQVMTMNGAQTVEAASRAQVMYDMEAILREEYIAREQEINKQKEEAGRVKVESDPEKPSENRSWVEKESDRRVRELPVHVHSARQRPQHRRMKAGTILDLISGAIALSHGNWIEAAFSAFSLAIGDWYENVESIWNKPKRRKIFACYFGGILIVAGSKRALMKKLTLQRNKRIQRIMMNIRYHNKERENASSTDNISKAALRLKNKKKKAVALTPKSWERRVSSPQGKQAGWQGRTLNLRERMKGKKTRARSLWVSKVC